MYSFSAVIIANLLPIITYIHTFQVTVGSNKNVLQLEPELIILLSYWHFLNGTTHVVPTLQFWALGHNNPFWECILKDSSSHNTRLKDSAKLLINHVKDCFANQSLSIRAFSNALNSARSDIFC